MLTYYIIAAIILGLANHLAGGFGLFRSEASKAAAERGEEHWFFDKRAWAFGIAFLVAMAGGLIKYNWSFHWQSLACAIALTATYIGYRQRSPNHIFFAGHGRNFPFRDKNGKESGNPAVNAIMKYVVRMDPAKTETADRDWLIRYGKIYGAIWGVLGLMPGAMLAQVVFGGWAWTTAFLGLPLGLYHYYLGVGGPLGENGMRGRGEIAEGILVIAAFFFLNLWG